MATWQELARKSLESTQYAPVKEVASSDLTSLIKDPEIAKSVLKMADATAYRDIENKDKKLNLLQRLGEVFSVDEWTDDAVRALQSWYDPQTGKATPLRGAVRTLGMPIDYLASGVRKVVGGAVGSKELSSYGAPHGKDLIPQLIATGQAMFDPNRFQAKSAAKGSALDYTDIQKDMGGAAKFASGALGMVLDTVATPSFWLSGSSSAVGKLAGKGSKTISTGLKAAGVASMDKLAVEAAEGLAAKALTASGLELTAENIAGVMKSSNFIKETLQKTLPKGLYKVGPLTKGATALKAGAVADTVARYIDNPLFAAIGDVWGKTKGIKVNDAETLGSTMDDMVNGVKEKLTERYAIKKFGGDAVDYHTAALAHSLNSADYQSKVRQNAIAHHMLKIKESGNTDAINQAENWIASREYWTGSMDATTLEGVLGLTMENPKQRKMFWDLLEKGQEPPTYTKVVEVPKPTKGVGKMSNNELLQAYKDGVLADSRGSQFDQYPYDLAEELNKRGVKLPETEDIIKRGNQEIELDKLFKQEDALEKRKVGWGLRESALSDQETEYEREIRLWVQNHKFPRTNEGIDLRDSEFKKFKEALDSKYAEGKLLDSEDDLAREIAENDAFRARMGSAPGEWAEEREMIGDNIQSAIDAEKEYAKQFEKPVDVPLDAFESYKDVVWAKEKLSSITNGAYQGGEITKGELKSLMRKNPIFKEWDAEAEELLTRYYKLYEESVSKENLAVKEIQNLVSQGFSPEVAEEAVIGDPYGYAKLMRDEAQVEAYKSYIPLVRKNKRWFLANEMMMADIGNYKEEIGPLETLRFLKQWKASISESGFDPLSGDTDKYIEELKNVDIELENLYKENPLLKYVSEDGRGIDMAAFYNEHPGFVALDNKVLRKELSLYKKDLANMDTLKTEELHLLLKRDSLASAVADKEITLPSEELNQVNMQLEAIAAKKIDLVSRKAQLDLQKEFRQLPQMVSDFINRSNYKGYKFAAKEDAVDALRDTYLSKVSESEVERLTQNQLGRDFFGAKVSEIESDNFDPLGTLFKGSGVERSEYSVNDFAYYVDDMADDIGYFNRAEYQADELGNLNRIDDLTDEMYHLLKSKLEGEISDLELSLKNNYNEELVDQLEVLRKKHLTNELLKEYSYSGVVEMLNEVPGKSRSVLLREVTAPYKEVGTGKENAKGFAMSKWSEVEDLSGEPTKFEKYLSQVGKRELFSQKKKSVKLIKRDIISEVLDTTDIKGVDDKVKFVKEAEDTINKAVRSSVVDTGGILTEAEEKTGMFLAKIQPKITGKTRIVDLDPIQLDNILTQVGFAGPGKDRLMAFIYAFKQEVAQQEMVFNQQIVPWIEKTLLPDAEKQDLIMHFKGLKDSSLLDMSIAENRKKVLNDVLALERRFKKIAQTGDARDQMAAQTMLEVFLRPMKEHAATYMTRKNIRVRDAAGKLVPLETLGLLGTGHRSLDVPEEVGEGVGNIVTMAKRKYANQAVLEGYNAMGVADPIKMKTDVESIVKDVVGYQVKEEKELLAFHEHMGNLIADLKAGKGGEGIKIKGKDEVLDPKTWFEVKGVPGLDGQGVYVTKELKPEFDMLARFWKRDNVKGAMKYVRFFNNIWKGVQTGAGVDTPQIKGKLYKEAERLGLKGFVDFYNEQAAFIPLSPAFTFRNTIGNLTASLLKGELGIGDVPARLSEAAEIQRAILRAEGASEFNQGLMGVLKSKIPQEQLDQMVEEIQKSGLLTETQVGNELIKNPEVTGKFLGKITSAATENKAMKFNNNMEMIWKIAVFRNARQAGKSVEDAVNTVHKALFDYSALSAFEQEYIRPYTVFYTWTKKNVELMADLMMNEPQKFKFYSKLLMEMPSQFSNISEEEREKLPDWTENMIGIPYSIGGETRYLSGFGGNLESFMEVMGAGGDTFGEQVKGGAMNAVDMLAPAFKIPFNLAVTGQNTFKGIPIEEDTSAYGYRALPAFMKKALGISEKQWVDKEGNTGSTYRMDGEKKYLIESTLGRASTVPLKALSILSGEDRPVAGLMDLALGLKTTRYDTDYLKYNDEKEQREALMRELERLGLVTQYTGYGYNTAGAQLNQPLIDEYLKSLAQ